MASITIRDLDNEVKRKLRLRAARHGRSMEEEARQILWTAVSGCARGEGSLYAAIRRRIEPLGGVDLPIAPRDPMRDPPRFDE